MFGFYGAGLDLFSLMFTIVFIMVVCVHLYHRKRPFPVEPEQPLSPAVSSGTNHYQAAGSSSSSP